jgi:beta-galactosidase
MAHHCFGWYGGCLVYYAIKSEVHGEHTMIGKLGRWTLLVGSVCALLVNSIAAAEKPGDISAEVTVPPLTMRPVSVAGTPAMPVDLSGTWRFNPAPPAELATITATSASHWKEIQVPGEWVMQGFHVKPDTPAAYFCTFSLAAKLPGERYKLRFSAVYSLCRVWVNGSEVGGHEGGFVPFELDVTDAVRTGVNTLVVSVQSESMLDKLSCGSKYASHPLGGISRKVQWFHVPDVHVSSLKIETSFDQRYHDATLTVRLLLRNQSKQLSKGSAVLTVVPQQGSAKIHVAPVTVQWIDLKPGESREETARIPVANPSKWDCEHPNLYTLIVQMKDDAGAEETIEEVFGFRQVEVRGTQVLVNGRRIRLHGVNRHEVHPLLGRALMPDLWQKDAELYREGNCNFIRTSHYPPAEEFIEACDRLGLFVELEAPLCWVGQEDGKKVTDSFFTMPVFQRLAWANLETVQGYPNHPSVIMRSLANESSWSSFFAQVHAIVSKADPTRPATFHDQCWGGYNNYGSTEMPIANTHYPGLDCGARWVEFCTKETRPVHCGEYCHLNCYNRLEVLTDPGLRDLWGQGLERTWNIMRKIPSSLGGSIWAGMDDTFFLPSGETVGYGVWGVLDGWRRPKPEFWNMKKVYSPVQLSATCVPAPAAGQPLRLEVENRHDFTDLSELQFDWKLDDQSGTVTTSGAPGGKTVLEIPVKGNDLAGKLLEIRAVSPRGFVEDVWNVAIGSDPRFTPPVLMNKPGSVTLKKTPQGFAVHGEGYVATIDGSSGMLTATGRNGKPSMLSGPELLLLPANSDFWGGLQMSGMEKDAAIFSNPCRNWKATSVKAVEKDADVEVRVEGAYTEAKGSYTLKFGKDGVVSVRYAFHVTDQGRCNPRQIGVVFTLPSGCDTLSWRRKAFWSDYPEDHIGRIQGTATATVKDVPLCGFAGPRVKPSWSWSQDGNKFGTNDFRSTKMNIFEASLRSAEGNGVRVLSDGSQHVRSWMDGNGVRLLAADFVNEGDPQSFAEELLPHRLLSPGAAVEGVVRIEIH